MHSLARITAQRAGSSSSSSRLSNLSVARNNNNNSSLNRIQARTMILRATTLAGGKGPLLAGQESLPSLPVPSLEQTLPKYLRTTLPHHQGNEASLKRTEAAVESALKGKDAALFKKLQERLQQRAQDPASDGNWLAAWWNDAAYMGYRDPVVPFVSYFYLHKDDRSRPTGSARAASQLKAMLQFRKLLESEELAPEKTKTGPMCSGSYPWMFNSCRIPEKPIDQAKKYDPSTHNHVAIARNGHFYEFDVIVDGQELSAAEIEAQLEKIIKDPAAATMDKLPVGALTSVDRDTWTDSRQALLNVVGEGGKHNQKVLERIESSIILICLDDAAPVTTEERSWNLWWGDGKNRFYDKQQLIVTNNGKAGYMGEHSTMDGTPTLRMNDFILSALPAGKIDLGTSKRTNLPIPQLLNFQLDKSVESRIASSIAAFEDLKAKHDLAVLEFHAYGKEAIKKFKCSPDAWVQMCIQVAFNRMFGKPAPTYESAQTRKFKWGRTETIRSCSPESQAFVEAFESGGKVPDEEVHALFQKAAKQHLSYAGAAANGEGVDRHLFGLKKLLQDGEELPDLYKDEMFAKSGHWLLSTSQISSESFDAWGYGEVVPDGFGCAYAIKSESLTFSLTSRKQDAAKLRHYINEVCLDLRDLHLRLASKSSSGEKAKM